MTDTPNIADAVRRSLQRRYRAERRFRFLGLGAILIGIVFVLMLFTSIASKGYTAFVQTQLELARSTTLYAAMAADERPLDVDHVLRARVVVDGAARLIGQEAIQMHGGIGVTAEHAVGHLTARLTALTRTWGDRRSHLAELATRIDDHEGVEVLV